MRLEDLENIISKDYNATETKKIMAGLKQKRFMSMRVNTLKSTKEKILEVLKNNGIKYEEVSWYDDALIILNKDEKFIRSLDIYQKGEIYLQSLSSMIPALVLEPKANEIILDMTAAPGSKTTQLAAISNNQAMITAVEKNKVRCERLKYNINKLGVKKVVVLNEDARYLDDNFKFDKILLDAPCSGSGTLYVQNEEIISQFDQDLIRRSTIFQEELLNKALMLLKPGGILVYSTCSILKRENELMIEKFLKSMELEVVEIDEKILKNIPCLTTNIKGAVTVMSDQYYEGFFAICLRKKFKSPCSNN